MLLTLIRKEIMHHLLSVRFIVLLLMCLFLVPLTLSINYHHYRQNLVDYQEAVKLANIEETTVNPSMELKPKMEISKLFLKPTPLSTFANGLADALPSYLGMTRNGVTHGPPALVSASLAYLLGHLDFLFLVGTVFSLLALLFTFDAVAGEKEAGTLRITLSNALPRDLFLWSKLIGGYIVFVVPFLVSFLFSLLLLVTQGFPISEPEVLSRIFSLLLTSLLYIGVFFAIGTLISTYLDNSKTALIIAFTVWVFTVLITPRVGFIAAKFIVPTQTSQSVYLEKTTVRENYIVELKEKKSAAQDLFWQNKPQPTTSEEIFSLNSELDKHIKPLEEELRQKYNDSANEINKRYKRDQSRQEAVAETLSRITPTSSLIYIVTNLTQTGKAKRTNYFQAGERYYDALDIDLFSKLRDYIPVRMFNPQNSFQITQPPVIQTLSLSETIRISLMDILLLCVFAILLTTIAFLKFFRSDI